MKRLLFIMMALVLALTMGLVPAVAAENNCPDLGFENGEVLPFKAYWLYPPYATFRVEVDAIGYNGPGWCADLFTYIQSGNIVHNGHAWISICLPDEAPGCVKAIPWGKINWVLNNWEDLGFGWQDAQVAMWSLIHNYTFTTESLWFPYNTDNVNALVAGAEADPDFDPEPGQLFAVALLHDNECPDYDFPTPDWPTAQNREPARQMILIQLERPEPPTYDICGYKYADWEGELIPLPGWTIELWAWNGTDWVWNATTITDADGKYCFTDLLAGNYTVKEVLKDGWEQVYPGNGHIVTLPLEKSVVYGTERATGNIWEVDATTGDATLVFTAPEPPSRSYSPGSPNGLAYDTINDRLYYTEYLGGGDKNSDLYFYDGVGQTFAGTLTGTIACADFYAGKYYYIAGNPTDDLYEVTFNADGTVASHTKLADISGNVHRWTFGGDIAISPDGVIYGLGSCAVSGHGYEFFKVNRDGLGFEMIKQEGYSFSLQLAFGSDGTLYGHASTGAGLFYAVDLATGDLSPAFPNSSNYLYTDLASGQSLYNFVNTPELVCARETAWALGVEDEAVPTTNNSVDGNPSSAWGWTNWVTGNTTMELWAGAGQNDITKGTLVGEVTVIIEGDCVTVTYTLDVENMDVDSSEILEAHLWIGDTELPLQWVARGRNGGSLVPTAAPGQFPYHIGAFDVSIDGLTATIEICVDPEDPAFDITGFWVAAHAVVKWCEPHPDAWDELEPLL